MFRMRSLINEILGKKYLRKIITEVIKKQAA